MPKPKPRYVLTENGLTKVKERLCEICGKKSPSQEAMAEKVGVHRNTIAKLLNRSQGVNRDTLDRLCSSLGWDLEANLQEDVDYKLWEQQVPDPTQETILCKNYKIIELLSTGEFSNTYLTENLDLPNNPQRIVKQLNSNCSEEARRLFTRETRVLSQLNRHPQIPTLFEYFEEDQDFYLVYEYIEGHSLSEELIEGQPWNESQVIDLLKEILNILVFVHNHESNIIHRDINPENLIRRQIDNKIVLINFAAVKEITPELTDRTYRGTKREYIAPEQQNGTPQLCSDIYGVGIVAIQALTGLHPERLRVDYNTGNIVWRNNAQVSQKFADVLDKMVCFSFQNRYQSAAEALKALQG